MEKYHVLQQIGNYEPSLIRSFNMLSQAETFTELMRISESHQRTKYYISEVRE